MQNCGRAQMYRPHVTGANRHVVMNGGRHTEAEERQYLALPSLQLMAFEGYASSWEDISTPSYWREYPVTRFRNVHGERDHCGRDEDGNPEGSGTKLWELLRHAPGRELLRTSTILGGRAGCS